MKTKTLLESFDEEALEVSTQESLVKPANLQNYYSIKLDKTQTSRTMEVRFLPNFDIESKKMKEHWVISDKHWISLNDPELDGFIDCQCTPGKKDCPICKTYWKYAKVDSPNFNKEKADSIKRNQKYYSYAYIIKDNGSEYEGTIQVLQYTYQVFEKIQNAINGSLGNKFNPFSPANGANFVYVISKGKQTFPVYSNSYFKETTRIDIAEKYAEEKPKLASLESFISVSTPEGREKASRIIAAVNGQHQVKIVPTTLKPVQSNQSIELEEIDNKEFFDLE